MKKVRRPQTARPLQVMLNYAPLGLFRATPRAIDLNGMTVDTGMVSLRRHSEVEVTLTLPDDPRRLHKLSASVASTGREGAKLTFHPYSRDTYELLANLIRHH